jgi:Holliday junction resolvase RusA-like endonuclease
VNYTPAQHPVNVFKAALQLALAEVYDGPPLTGPLGVNAMFILPCPKSRQKKNYGKTWHTTKPDIDNLQKALFDALNGLAWVDDKQIAEAVIRKQWAGKYDQAGCSVSIWKKG